MHFSGASRFHRFVSSCVVALLTANAFAIALIETNNPLSSADAPHELTLITTSDGHRYLVDPNTAAGKQAIDEAKRVGSTLQNVPVPTTSSTALASKNPGPSTPLLTLPPVNGVLPIDPGSTLDQTINNILNTVTTVSSVVGGVVTTVSSILGDTQSTVTSLLDETQSTIDQVSTTLAGVVTTVSTTVGGVVTTVSTTVATVSTTLGGVVTTLSTLLNQLSSTTLAPTTTTTIKLADPICGLLPC
jgi:hypothetical protein